MADISALNIPADSTQLAEAVKELKNLVPAARAAENAAGSFGREASKAGAAAKQAGAGADSMAGSAARVAREYQNARSAVDPLYAASKRYEAALRTIKQALDGNVISQDEFNRVSRMAADTYLASSAAMQQNARAFNAQSYAVTNASYQVQDFIVQVTSGTDAMRAFAQQAPQLLGSFGFAGPLALWGSIAGTVIAGGAAIMMSLRDTEEASKKAKSALDNYSASLGTYVSSVGSAADATNAFNTKLGYMALGDTFDNFNTVLDSFATKAEGSYGWLKSIGDELAGRRATGQGQIVNELENIAEFFGRPMGEATGLQQAIQQIAEVDRTDLTQIVSSVKELDALLSETYGTRRLAPPEVQEFWRNVLQMGAEASSEINAQMDSLGQNLGRVNEEITRAIAEERERVAMAQEYVAATNAQAEIARASYQYGVDSAEVEALKREEAERALDVFIEQNSIADEQAMTMRDAHTALLDAGDATADWARLMADVNAQLSGAYSLISAIGGGMIQRAGVNAAERVLDSGGSALEAERARRRAEEITRIRNEGSTAAGFRSAGSIDAEIAALQAQWDEADAYADRLAATRDAEREAAKSGRSRGGSGGRSKVSEAERAAQKEHNANLREAERIYENTRTDIERLKIEQADLNELYEAGYFGPTGSIAAMDTLSRAMQDVREQYDPLIQKTNEWGDSITQNLANWWTGAQSFSDAISNIIGKLAEMAAMEAFNTITKEFLDAGISTIVGAIFPNAKGGVYSSPSLSEYSNSVVSKPTMFAFAKGAGLMGEAGAEAIMPLTRGPDGRLGVTTHGAGSGGASMEREVTVKLEVAAVEGNTFEPRVRAISNDESVRVVSNSVGSLEKQLPERIEEHLQDRRSR